MEKLNNKLSNYEKNNLETSLLIALEEALKNENFNNLVSKLNMTKEQLCKYTSTLEESAIEFSHCQSCKGLANCQNKVTGYAYLPKKNNNKLEFNYKACKYQNKIINQNKFLNNVYLFEIPKVIKEAKMKDIYTNDKNRFEVIKWIKEFIKRYEADQHIKGLYLYGSFGSGKTYLISALFNELAKKNIKSAIVFWPEYLNKLKNSFNGDKDEFKNLLEKIKRSPLLLIDDIGAENVTPWSRDEVLSPILQYRMEEMLPTFFTSNLDKQNLEIHFSSSKNGVEEVKARRIMERINQLTEKIDLISGNLRK
ncbi:MAG: primosomal protein DnaI [Bacilli bacterium]|nr:primosomal protein DnaI [Bacilli bacterium]